MLTQTCTENLLSDITDICTNIVEDLKADIVHKLTSGPITLPTILIEEISETFENEIYRQPFIGLETQYKQLQFYRKHLNFVVRFITYVYIKDETTDDDDALMYYNLITYNLRTEPSNSSANTSVHLFAHVKV